MTDNIVNLRMVRKVKKRAEKDAAAQENRVKFGRTKAERAFDKSQKDKSKRVFKLDENSDTKDE